jgi:hypothetical protein
MKPVIQIIPDIHLRWKRVDAIIKEEGADQVILLGDYFDDFGDDYRENAIMADWLVASLQQPNRIHIMGNHDISYAIPTIDYKCSGYETGKDYAINSIMKDEHWKQLKLYHWIDDTTLCSHAGVHNYFFKTYGKGMEFKPWLEKTCKHALEKAFDCKPPEPILKAGRSRGGTERFGGIMWCDSMEFQKVSGVKQIFGHTPCLEPFYVHDQNDLCLDTHNRHYAIYFDGKVTIKCADDIR